MNFARVLTVLGMAALVTITGCGQETGVETARQMPDGPPDLIAREALFGNPDKAGVQLSPDGTQLSWLEAVDGVLNVWVAPVDDLSAARAVTNDTNRGIRQYFWAYTNKHLVYLQDLGGDENWLAYSVNLETDSIKDLTPMQEVRVQIQELSPQHPEEILVGINERDPRLHDLYRLNIDSGELTMIEENPKYVGYLTDDEFRVRFAAEMVEGGGSKWHRRTMDGRWEEFIDVPSDDTLTTQLAGFDKSGDTLYLIDSRDRNTAALFAWDLKTNETEVIYENDRADVSDTLFHPTEYTIQAASSTFDRVEWEILDDSIRKDLEYLGGVADGEMSVIDRTLDDKTWIVGYELAEKPYSYYMYDREAGKAEFLFSNRSALQDATMANMYSRVIKSRDGLDLVSYLTLPLETDAGNGIPTEPQPMVLFVHGGPWARDNWGYHPYHQWLANRGYAVLSVNFRGSTGMGKDFTNASNGEWAGKMHDDLLDAVDWAVAEGIADRDQVAIMGGSYGGYATLVGLTFTPETFACGVDIVGPSNIVTLIESIPPYWEPMLDLFAARVGDHTTEGGRTMLMERSPLTHVDKITKPLLIGQGANDPRVKQAESDQIVEAMQTKEIPVTYVLFPDEGHGFARPENRMAFNAVTETFLADCLGGRVEPLGDDLAGSSITVPAGASGIAGLREALGEAAEETETTADVAAGD